MSKDGLLREYCDGEAFKTHPLFTIYPNALQLMLFYDDIEVCNPLGSKARTHKLGTDHKVWAGWSRCIVK